MYMLNSVLVVL